jgi:PadR family transcriptional regulator, regulatory protein PadR
MPGALALLAWLAVLSPWSLPVPGLIFALLVRRHALVIRARDTAGRAITFYERGLARLEDRWAGTGEHRTPVDFQHECVALSCRLSTGAPAMSPQDAEVPYGTLDLMVLKTLAAMGPLHGYGIARRIEQLAQGGFALNQGTIYPALVRLEQKGWIRSAWGTSDNNRRARFYTITATGRRQLAAETALWTRTVSMMSRLLESE